MSIFVGGRDHEVEIDNTRDFSFFLILLQQRFGRVNEKKTNPERIDFIPSYNKFTIFKSYNSRGRKCL